jgi:hypothetical protein
MVKKAGDADPPHALGQRRTTLIHIPTHETRNSVARRIPNCPHGDGFVISFQTGWKVAPWIIESACSFVKHPNYTPTFKENAKKTILNGG